MKKEKRQKTNAMRLIEAQKLPYEIHCYPWKEDELDGKHVANALERPVGQVFKTLVLVGDKTGVLVALVSSEASIDLKKMAKVSGNKKVEMLPLKELEKTTGYIRGGCSPLGMKKEFPTYLSDEMKAWESVLFSAGKRGQQIELKVEYLIALTKGKLVDLVKEG